MELGEQRAVPEILEPVPSTPSEAFRGGRSPTLAWSGHPADLSPLCCDSAREGSGSEGPVARPSPLGKKGRRRAEPAVADGSSGPGGSQRFGRGGGRTRFGFVPAAADQVRPVAWSGGWAGSLMCRVAQYTWGRERCMYMHTHMHVHVRADAAARLRTGLRAPRPAPQSGAHNDTPTGSGLVGLGGTRADSLRRSASTASRRPDRADEMRP